MGRIFYGWWVVLACSLLTTYVAGVVFSGFTAFFQPIRETFGWSYTEVSLATSIRGLEMGIFAPFVGALVDRYGARRLIIFGTVTIGLGLILLGFTQSLSMFYGAFLLIAFGAGGCAAVVLTTAVVNWFDRKVGVALAVMGAGVGAGGLMIPVIVWLIDVYQWRTALFVLGTGMWVIGLPLSLLIRNSPEEYGYAPDGEILRPSTAERVVQSDTVELGLKDALGERSFLYLNVAEFIRFMVFGAVSVHVMPYFDSIGMDRRSAGFVAAAIPLFSILGRFFFGRLGDIRDKKKILAWSFFVMSLGTGAFCFVKARLLIIPFLLLFSTGLGGAMVLRSAFLREYFGRASFGKLIGILMGSGSLGGVLGPLMSGWAYDTFGGYGFIWLFFGCIMLLATGLVMRIRVENVKSLAES
ncbi:MAG: MFS transporter [Deltaproteobacteria bacterium]|nr:MFS transporter [Deltaproteobacteria bacterium]